jgi:hypothetical protein
MLTIATVVLAAPAGDKVTSLPGFNLTGACFDVRATTSNRSAHNSPCSHTASVVCRSTLVI